MLWRQVVAIELLSVGVHEAEGLARELAHRRQADRIEGVGHSLHKSIPRVVAVAACVFLCSAPVALNPIELVVKFGQEDDLVEIVGKKTTTLTTTK